MVGSYTENLGFIIIINLYIFLLHVSTFMITLEYIDLQIHEFR